MLSSADAIGNKANGNGGCEAYHHNYEDRIELTKMAWLMGARKDNGSIEALIHLELIRAKGERKGSNFTTTSIGRFVLGVFALSTSR